MKTTISLALLLLFATACEKTNVQPHLQHNSDVRPSDSLFQVMFDFEPEMQQTSTTDHTYYQSPGKNNAHHEGQHYVAPRSKQIKPY